jgi:D-alanine transaminase
VLEDTRWARCDIKSIALLANVLLRQQAADAGAAEALLVRDGWLTEGSSSSVFLCAAGRLITPPNSHSILPGTTRDAVLDWVDWLDEEIRPVARAELDTADEVWIGSAGRGVLPVTSIDGRAVGDGSPGPQWRRTHACVATSPRRDRRDAAALSHGQRLQRDAPVPISGRP